MNINNMNSPARRKWPALALALVLCTAVLLGGCKFKEPTVAAEVSGYDHMPKGGWYIAGFSVNGASGPNLQPQSGGGKFNCCISIPERWKPGMKAKVEWMYDVGVGDPRTPPPPQEAEVDIPDYNPVGPGTVDVHFYPDHRVKVVVSNFAIRHPRYAMSEEDKLPWKTDWSLLGHSSMKD
jgi:hypothetical protein